MFSRFIALFLLLISTVSASTKAVVFDWGYVMAVPNKHYAIEFLMKSLHLSKKELIRGIFQRRSFVEEERLDLDFWVWFAQEENIEVSEDWPEHYRAVLEKGLGIDHEMYQLVDQLKEKGLRVGLLSNVERRFKTLINGFDLYKPFSPCLLSCDIGVEKPHRRAYEILIDHLQLKPEEIVFIDDRKDNIAGAKKLGIDAIQFKSRKQLTTELKNRGLL